MKKHPTEVNLALFAGGDCSPVSRFLLERHLRRCTECEETVAEFMALRSEATADDLPAGLDWNKLAAEMGANIHLGLEAGECVRPVRLEWRWSPRIAVAFASLVLLAGANFALRNTRQQTGIAERTSTPVLESTGSGLELRTGASSLTILNQHGVVADQTVSAQGEIRARYIDGDTGAVTINNVYLE